MPYSWHPMDKITYVVGGQASTLKCPLIQSSEVSLQSVKVAGIEYFWKFYFKDVLFQGYLISRILFQGAPKSPAKMPIAKFIREMEKEWKCWHVLSPWPNLLMTFLSFPSAFFLKQGRSIFLLIPKLTEGRSFSGSEVQLHVSQTPCRFISNFQSFFFFFFCLFLLGKKKKKKERF